jgi:putative transposase
MARRDAAVRAMRDHDISQRRACVLVGVDPKTVRRERPPDNPEIREEMHKIAESAAGLAIGAWASCLSARA